MKKLLLVALLALAPSVGWAQIQQLTVGGNPVKGGTDGQCLTIDSGRLGAAACGGSATDITVGSTGIGGGTSGRVLYDNAGVVGQLQTTGTGTVVATTGSPTAGNVAIFGTPGVVDIGVQLLTSMSQYTLWGRMSSGSGAPSEIGTILFGNGSASAPPYSFNASTGTGLFSPATDQVALAAGGNKMLQARTGNATNFVEILYSGGNIIRSRNAAGDTTAFAMTLASNGNARVTLANNSAGTNGLLASFAGPATAGNPSNYLLFTVGDGSGNGPTISPLVQGTGDTEIPININPVTATSSGLVRSNGTFVSKVSTAIGAGSATQSMHCASSTAGFCIYYGTGAPSFSAAKGSLYIQTNATTTTTRLYVNTDGATTWANFTSSS